MSELLTHPGECTAMTSQAITDVAARPQPEAVPTLLEVRSWPATVDLPAACVPLGISKTVGYELARQGRFPVKIVKVGRRYRVITASLVRFLAGESDGV